MTSLKRQAAYQRGCQAEDYACTQLQQAGYIVLMKRYKSPVGEIDIVALKADMLVFMEVKAHQQTEASAYAITLRQQQRIIRAALHFVVANPHLAHHAMRFDAFLYHETRSEWIEQAFDAPDEMM